MHLAVPLVHHGDDAVAASVCQEYTHFQCLFILNSFLDEKNRLLLDSVVVHRSSRAQKKFWNCHSLICDAPVARLGEQIALINPATTTS